MINGIQIQFEFMFLFVCLFETCIATIIAQVGLVSRNGFVYRVLFYFFLILSDMEWKIQQATRNIWTFYHLIIIHPSIHPVSIFPILLLPTLEKHLCIQPKLQSTGVYIGTNTHTHRHRRNIQHYPTTSDLICDHLIVK